MKVAVPKSPSIDKPPVEQKKWSRTAIHQLVVVYVMTAS